VTKWKVMGRSSDRKLPGSHSGRHQPHASVARALCRNGISDFGDDIYGNGAGQRRARQIKFVQRAHAPGLKLHAREVVVPISRKGAGARHRALPAHLCERFTLCGWNGARRRRSERYSQRLHLNAGAASPGSTMTAVVSPHLPHWRVSLVGSFTTGLVAFAIA
jgi:hypothetical protein